MATNDSKPQQNKRGSTSRDQTDQSKEQVKNQSQPTRDEIRGTGSSSGTPKPPRQPGRMPLPD